MKNFSDVAVVGGGPSGSFAAFNLAKQGAKVTVFEEHGDIGVPSHCPGHLSIEGLKRLGLYPLPKGIAENTFRGAMFHSPNGKSFSVRFSHPVTCVVNRILFDRYIAEMAEGAGVEYLLNSQVESLVVEDGFVKGASIRQHGNTTKESAKIVVDAEGVSSRILRLAGLSSLNRYMLANGVHAEAENVKDIELDMVEVFLGKDYADGFYAWLIPIGDGKAKVGLAAKTGNPKELLGRLMLKHPVASKKLKTAKIMRMGFHPVTLGGPITESYGNGFLAVGDVASQVKPTTGGGVVFGMTCARVAANVAYEALSRNDFSSEFLRAYQRRCKEILGFDTKVMLGIRRMLDTMSDDRLDKAISLCKKLNLDKSFQNVKDIDFQGHSILSLLPNPRMLAALFYFFFLFLSANP
jgi:digeranylgeranylglycerophospholipid reductase